uniref:structural maintenance of chromosomes protein 5-like n=1 Tax=Myxine glutinosa TaxID=7769 RepID=UPI00358E3DF0
MPLWILLGTSATRNIVLSGAQTDGVLTLCLQVPGVLLGRCCCVPSLLGRVDKLGHFVKQGKEKSVVEIELFKARKNATIIREIVASSNMSTWAINGIQVGQKQVEEQVEALNIHVENHCQFLPQEMVEEFAKMTKIEILGATEKSVGPTEMYNLHLQLKSLQQSNKEMKNKCDEKEKHILKLQRQNERNRQEMQQHNEYKKYVDQITLLEKKKHIVADTKAHWRDLKKDSLYKKDDEVEEARQNLNLKKNRVWRGIQQQIQTLQNQENMRLGKLRLRYPDTHEAVLWLKQNKERFQGLVFEPVMLLIHVKSQPFAKYIENHIAMKDLKAFVFEKENDLHQLLKLMRDEKHLRVNAVRAPSMPPNSFKAPYSLDDLKKRPYCFGYFLRELFDAPDAIMSYLCQRYRVHEVPLGTETTKENVEQVIKTFSLSTFHTPESRVLVKKSVYSGQKITSNTALREPQLLTEALDVEQCQQLQQQLQLLNSQIVIPRFTPFRPTKVSREDNELRKKKKQLGERKNKRRALEQRIHMRKESLAIVETSEDSFRLRDLRPSSNASLDSSWDFCNP